MTALSLPQAVDTRHPRPCRCGQMPSQHLSIQSHQWTFTPFAKECHLLFNDLLRLARWDEEARRAGIERRYRLQKAIQAQHEREAGAA